MSTFPFLYNDCYIKTLSDQSSLHIEFDIELDFGIMQFQTIFTVKLLNGVQSIN